MNALKRLIKSGRKLWTLLTATEQFEDNDGLALRLLAEVVTAAAEIVNFAMDPSVSPALLNLGAILDRKAD